VTAEVRILPMTDSIGSTTFAHGERGELDWAHREACLCGVEYYMDCPHYLDGIDNIMSLVLYPSADS